MYSSPHFPRRLGSRWIPGARRPVRGGELEQYRERVTATNEVDVVLSRTALEGT